MTIPTIQDRPCALRCSEWLGSMQTVLAGDAHTGPRTQVLLPSQHSTRHPECAKVAPGAADGRACMGRALAADLLLHAWGQATPIHHGLQ